MGGQKGGQHRIVNRRNGNDIELERMRMACQRHERACVPVLYVCVIQVLPRRLRSRRPRGRREAGLGGATRRVRVSEKL